MYYDLARRLLRWRIYLLLGLALLAVIVGQTGFRMLGTSACEALPSFQPTVSDDLRADLELLHARGLLYCKPLREGLDDVDPIVYWAADGMNSLLFFQATAGADLSDVGVSSYLFSDGQNNYFPSLPGDQRPRDFLQAQEGGRVWANQAVGDRPAYFVRREAAPGSSVGVVMVSVSGPLAADEGVTDRDFLKDLEQSFGWLRGEAGGSTGAAGRGTRDLNFLIDQDRWASWVQRDTNPAFLTADGRPDSARLSREPLSRPQLYQRVQGLLGSAVWVAGVVSGTQGTLRLAPKAGVAPLVPRDAAQWIPVGKGSPMMLFSFPPLPAGEPYEARYWSDPATVEAGAEPDQRFAVVFSDPPALATAAAGGRP
ncbi:MAG: hypothetical protein ACH37Z_07065 [Anaerolineae bacterium]|jgi:hypothetical protein|nr:hypothetical protein [Anaerolineae bacterium]HRA19557.1 hypothetical protein [Anaerolineae bacterium]